MQNLIDYLNSNIMLIKYIVGKDLKKIEHLKFNEIRGELKHRIILALKLLNLNQTFQLFKPFDKDLDLSVVKKALNIKTSSLRRFHIKGSKEDYTLEILYKNIRIKYIGDANLEALDKLKILMINIEVGKNKNRHILVSEQFLNSNVSIASLEQIGIKKEKVKPLVIRRFLEAYGLKIKKLKIQVGGEVGGIQGLNYITLEGEDVLKGIENFYSRYKSRSIMFHKIGPIVSVTFENNFMISIKGEIKITNIMDLFNFIEFLE